MFNAEVIQRMLQEGHHLGAMVQILHEDELWWFATNGVVFLAAKGEAPFPVNGEHGSMLESASRVFADAAVAETAPAVDVAMLREAIGVPVWGTECSACEGAGEDFTEDGEGEYGECEVCSGHGCMVTGGSYNDYTRLYSLTPAGGDIGLNGNLLAMVLACLDGATTLRLTVGGSSWPQLPGQKILYMAGSSDGVPFRAAVMQVGTIEKQPVPVVLQEVADAL